MVAVSICHNYWRASDLQDKLKHLHVLVQCSRNTLQCDTLAQRAAGARLKGIYMCLFNATLLFDAGGALARGAALPDVLPPSAAGPVHQGRAPDQGRQR